MEANSHITYSEAARRSQLISQTPIVYTLRLSLEETSFSGSVLIAFDLKNPSSELWVDYSGSSISHLNVNGKDQLITRNQSKLILPKLPQGKVELRASFSSFYSSNGTGLHKFIDPCDNCVYIYSYMCPFYANKVFPCFDQPDLKGTFKISIEAPSHFAVISNEFLESRENLPNYSVHHFKPTKPISTYILGIVCGDFVGQVNSEKQIGVFCRKSLSRYLQYKDIVDWIEMGKEFFRNYFGVELVFSKHDQVFCPEFNMGAMENAGCVTVNDSSIWKEEPVKSEKLWLCNTTLHELCHMWFGNLVTMKWWDDLWLNESFATYFSYAAMNEEDSWITFLWYKCRGYSVDRLSSTHPVHVTVPDTQLAMSNLDAITYSKGSALLKQLVFSVGDSCFSSGMKEYFSKFAWKNVTMHDFVSAVQKNTQVELEDWISSWVESEGLNSIMIVYSM